MTLPVHRCFSSRTCASKFDDHLTDLQQQQQQQQQPAAASSYPQMHIHQLMHLVNRCSLKDLHSFGCSLMWEQVRPFQISQCNFFAALSPHAPPSLFSTSPYV